MPAKLQILFAKTLHSLEEFTIFAPKKLKTMAKYLLARYIWEVGTIYRAHRITQKRAEREVARLALLCMTARIFRREHSTTTSTRASVRRLNDIITRTMDDIEMRMTVIE